MVAFWESDIEGVISVANEPNGSGELLGADYLLEGDHFLTLSVEDSSGKTGTDSLLITVGPPNSPPLCAITVPINGAAGPLLTV